MKSKSEKRSPLKDNPLRYAGQSLDEQIEDLRYDAVARVTMTFMLIIGTLVAWFAYQNPPRILLLTIAILFTISTIAYVGLTVNFVLKAVKESKRLAMARDGEKIVAEGLQEMIGQGATVINDIQGDNFNIDHVVVSKNGIYLIETKTYSKPINKETRITSDNANIYVDGVAIERNPIKQVKALTSWLQNLLKESTGKSFRIRPVVLFPGWYTEKMKGGEDIWILNPKALPAFISNEPVSLKDTDAHLVAFHLSRYVRTFAPKTGK